MASTVALEALAACSEPLYTARKDDYPRDRSSHRCSQRGFLLYNNLLVHSDEKETAPQVSQPSSVARRAALTRRSLIMFLIAGDVIRSLWMLIIACIALRNHGIDSSSPVCQASGWLIQFGTVMNGT
jgi:hypothetical protein